MREIAIVYNVWKHLPSKDRRIAPQSFALYIWCSLFHTLYHYNLCKNSDISWKKQRITKFFRKNRHYVLSILYFCKRQQPVLRWCPLSWAELWAGHYIIEKRHTMLCRLASWNYHNLLQVKDNAELMSRVCWKHIPSCAWGLVMPSTHTNGCISNSTRGYHSVRQLARAVVGLRKRMSRRWIPTFFCCAVN